MNKLKNAKKLKGRYIFTNEDFAQEPMELLNKPWQKVKKI